MPWTLPADGTCDVRDDLSSAKPPSTQLSVVRSSLGQTESLTLSPSPVIDSHTGLQLENSMFVGNHVVSNAILSPNTSVQKHVGLLQADTFMALQAPSQPLKRVRQRSWTDTNDNEAKLHFPYPVSDSEKDCMAHIYDSVSEIAKYNSSHLTPCGTPTDKRISPIGHIPRSRVKKDFMSPVPDVPKSSHSLEKQSPGERLQFMGNGQFVNLVPLEYKSMERRSPKTVTSPTGQKYYSMGRNNPRTSLKSPVLGVCQKYNSAERKSDKRKDLTALVRDASEKYNYVKSKLDRRTNTASMENKPSAVLETRKSKQVSNVPSGVDMKSEASCVEKYSVDNLHIRETAITSPITSEDHSSGNTSMEEMSPLLEDYPDSSHHPSPTSNELSYRTKLDKEEASISPIVDTCEFYNAVVQSPEGLKDLDFIDHTVETDGTTVAHVNPWTLSVSSSSDDHQGVTLNQMLNKNRLGKDKSNTSWV